MQPQIKQQLVNTMFGEYYGNKLTHLLRDCCTPHISVNFNATCAGLDMNGNPEYNVTASITYNTSISGYTSITGYLSNQPFPDITALTTSVLNSLNISTATYFVGAINAGVPCVSGNVTVQGINPDTYYVMITDNHGNYATPITITFPVCPKG